MGRSAWLAVAAAIVSCWIPPAIAASPASQSQPADRAKVRLLYGFEEGTDGSPISGLLKGAERIDIITVRDNGVTEGRQCARMTIRHGGRTGCFFLEPQQIRDWGDFDYFAMDVYTDLPEPCAIIVELWDAGSANGEYHSRCTFENVQTHPGQQTLLYRINRPVRNGKQEWNDNQLEPGDRINLNALTRVKIFTASSPDRDEVFWIDNIRLMREGAARPKMSVSLPDGAIGFKFGGAADAMEGFTTVSPATVFGEASEYGFVSPEGLAAGGEGWPDPLTGTFVWSPDGQVIEFRAEVPPGEYLAWLAAGKVVRSGLKDARYHLSINDEVLCDENPSSADLAGEKYIYRFMWTQYSRKPHALWRGYIDRMYPAEIRKVAAKDGQVRLTARNHFTGALILVPAGEKAAFDEMTAAIERARIDTFERTLYAPPQTWPHRRPGDGDFVLFVPEAWRDVMPWTAPTRRSDASVRIEAAGTPGQRVVMRLAVCPFVDIGRCALELADLKGPGTIPASNIKGHFRNYRFDGKSFAEMALLPSLTLEMEEGIAECFWLWMKVPDDAAPGTYEATFTFRPGKGKPVEVPVTFKVYPFRLEAVLPVSYGMYSRNERRWPAFAAGSGGRRLTEQFEWMRQIGFTAAEVDVPRITSLKGKDKVELRIRPTRYELARQVGMAQCPEQAMLAVWLQVGRQVGRLLPDLGVKVDREPGCELRELAFANYYLDACRQYREFLGKVGVPVALEVVDEPREVPNPWNRNLADTIRYSNLLRQVGGLTLYVSPMRDSDGGLDYTVLVNHFDVLALHSYDKSAAIMHKTLRTPGKRLWIYNSGKDRFSWGFYVWRAKAAGRWEWNFCWPEDRAVGGYPGREWYNPFTGLDGLAPYAPEDKYPGGMLYQSAYLQICEGINDYAYLYTLSKAIDAAGRAGRHADAVAEAKAFLASLNKQIPEFLPCGDGNQIARALQTGEGLLEGVRKMDQWRRQIADFIQRLQ
jgi:hypothetical protein